MKKDYVQPTMRVFNISADERIAANCMVTHNQNTDWCQTAEHFGVPSGCWVFESVNSN